MRLILILLLVVGCSAETFSERRDKLSTACAQGQIFGNAQHTGTSCAPLERMEIVATITQDPSAYQQALDYGFLAVHYGSALSAADGWVYVPGKSGYTDLFTPATQTWSVSGHRWQGAKLRPRWEYASQWQPFDVLRPVSGTTAGYEALFQPALSGDSLYVPERYGRVARLDRSTGVVFEVIDPLAGTPFSGDSAAMLNSALTVDGAGNVYFTVVAWDPSGSTSASPRESWLVRVSPSGVVDRVPWTQVTNHPAVKQGTDLCYYVFQFASPVPPRPWPPSPSSQPPQFACGKQRPPVNAAPAVTRDGLVVVQTTANNATTYAYLVAYDFAAGAPVWAASTRDQIADGCGVKIPENDPSNSDPFACRHGANPGVDPQTNQLVAGRMSSLVESAPVIAPDGTVYVSTYSGGYDNNQGHLHRFSSTGQFLNLIDYGWETTPVVRRVGSGPSDFELVMDYNAFSPTTGDGTGDDVDASVVRLTPDLQVISQARVPLQPDAWANDFLDGQAAVDSQGNVYALNATGDVYKIAPNGDVLSRASLGVTVEALATEMSWGSDGLGRPVLYVGFAGTVYAIGG